MGRGDSRVYRRSTRAGMLALGLLIVTGVGVAVGVLDVSNSIGVAFATAVLVVALAPTIVRLHQGRFDLFEPTFGAGVMLALLFGIRPIYAIANPSFSYVGYQIEAEFSTAIGLGLLGTGAFMIGYWGLRIGLPVVSGGQHRGREPAASTVAKAPAIWIGLLAGVLGLTLFAINLLRLGSPAYAISLWLAGRSSDLVNAYVGSSAYLALGPVLLACGATAIGVVSGWQLARWQWVLVVAMVATSALIFSVGGDRRFLLPCIGVPVAAYYLSTGSRPGRTLMLALVPVAFVILAIIPFARAAGAREQAGGVIPIFADAFGAPLTAWDRFIMGPDTEMVSALALQVGLQRTPDDFYYGRATLGDLLIAPIPSAIFPLKPVSARDDLLIRAFGAPCTVLPGTLCPDFSAIGTFYQDLWWIGVIIGMAALGGMSRSIWMRYKARPRSPQRILMAATWAISLPILIRAGFMPSFSWWLVFLVPTSVITAFGIAWGGRFTPRHGRPLASTSKHLLLPSSRPQAGRWQAR